jgi:hypothetical protein
MGRSVSPPDQRLPFQDQAVASFEAAGLHYAVTRKTNGIVHREFAPGGDGRVVAEQDDEVAFAVGSGRQGQPFLVNRAGRLFESPVGWYARKKAWDLSPGFERNNEHFSRPIPEACLFCHANEAHVQPDTVNRYSPALLRLEVIGCERCHGPGELHVAARARSEVPDGHGLTSSTRAASNHTCASRSARRQLEHRPRRPHRAPHRPPAGSGPLPDADDHPRGVALVHFRRDLTGGRDGGNPRDLGLALVEMMDRPLSEPQRRELARKACGLLRPAVRSGDADLTALEGLGLALWKDGRPHDALETLESVLRQAPRRELALERAARVAMESGDIERGVGYWRRLIEANPYSWKGHGFLAQTLALGERWAAAVEERRSALQLNLFEVPTRMLLIDCLIRLGQKEQARTEFDPLLALRPPKPDGLRRWFDELLRGK